MSYVPSNHYWFVGGDETRVFSSAAPGYVPADDATYVAWSAVPGNLVTMIDSEASLAEVLACYGLFISAAAGLMAYANLKQWALATGGYTITLSGQVRTFATDDISRGLMTGKFVRLTQPNPPTTMSWQFATGFEDITAADFAKAALAAGDFVQATFDALRPIIAAIKAGTITTTAGVDAAAWPSAIAPA